MLAARAVALACALVGSAAYTVVPDTAINLVGDSSDAANRMEMRKAEMAKMQEARLAEREKMKAQKEEMKAQQEAMKVQQEAMKAQLAQILSAVGGGPLRPRWTLVAAERRLIATRPRASSRERRRVAACKREETWPLLGHKLLGQVTRDARGKGPEVRNTIGK